MQAKSSLNGASNDLYWFLMWPKTKSQRLLGLKPLMFYMGISGMPHYSEYSKTKGQPNKIKHVSREFQGSCVI